VSEPLKLVVLYLYAYLVGSIPIANIIARLRKGIDLREHGTKTVGGSNLARQVGKFWVVPMGLVDVFIKGSSSVWIGHYVPFFGWDLYSLELMGAGLFAIAGHNWSIYLRFHGGRGIAVTIGVLFAIAKWELALFSGVALALLLIIRGSGVSTYLALLLLPLWTLLPWLPLHRPLDTTPMAVTCLMVGIVALVSAKRLLSNWSRLPRGVPKRQVFLNRLFKDKDV
jgi:glycerol-3-phosphate acyltransferase PlsY